MTTVSRWLSGQSIRNAAAEEAAVRELSYRPNAMAQSLKSGRRGVIGVVVPEITNPFFAAAVKGLEQASRELSYRFLLANSDESNEHEAEILADLAGLLDGFIMAPAHEHDRAPLGLHEAGVPAVLRDRRVRGGGLFDVVIVDNVGGAASAARHLIGLGHSSIAMINGPTDTAQGRERREGFVGALADIGLELVPEYDLTGDCSRGARAKREAAALESHRATNRDLHSHRPDDGGSLDGSAGHAVRVPAAVSIVGIDDVSLGFLLQSPLTCVSRLDVEQGALAMPLLFVPDRRSTSGPSQSNRS